MPELILTCQNEGERLDVFISSNCDEYSRSFFNQLIKDGKVEVNGVTAKKSGLKLEAGDVIRADIPLKKYFFIYIIYNKGT